MKTARLIAYGLLTALGLCASTAAEEIKVGVEISATSGPAMNVRAALPVPMEWPEQTVAVLREESNGARYGFQVIGGSAKQLMVNIPRLQQGETARVVITFDVVHNPQTAPEHPELLVIPKGKALSKEARGFLGASPGIETKSKLISDLLPEIIRDKETAWSQVEAIYDWVRETVKYQNGPFKGAVAALKDRSGDCEELTSLIIAFCRAHGVPARMVWVPGHCYPEFYLADAEGKGAWYPCQAAGDKAFGWMNEPRPILQKGDNFRVPARGREPQRYLAEYLTANGTKPEVQWIRPGVGAFEEANALTSPVESR